MRPVRSLVLVVSMLLVAGGITPAAIAAPVGAPQPESSEQAAADGLGTWKVASVGGEHRVRWTSETPLPIRSSRPEIVDADGRALGATRIVGGGRTVEVTVEGPRPDVSALDVVLAGDRLDEVGQDDPVTSGSQSLPRLPLDGLGADPGKRGSAAVTTTNYTLAPAKLAGMPAPVEMVGHVVEPAIDPGGPLRPLIVFLHGRHSWCHAKKDSVDTDTWPCVAKAKDIPSERGYHYLQELLASQGYATVSIRANGINAQDWRLEDGGADARARLIALHLEHWQDLAAGHRVDLDRVVLVGHSRGGEGVNRLAIRGAGDAVTVVGQLLVAPTDFADQRSVGVPTVTVLPYCDGDVSDLQGQRYVDASRELAPDDSAMRSTVLLMGANHNYFNTEWTPGEAVAPAFDDWYGAPKAYCGAKHPQRLSASQQRDAASVLVSGAVRLFAEHDAASLPLFDGSAVTTETLAPAITWSAAVGGDRDTRFSITDLTAEGRGAAKVSSCRAVQAPGEKDACGRGRWENTPHWPDPSALLPEVSDVEVAWDGPGEVASLALSDPIDLTGRHLQMRVIQDPRRATARFRARVIDGEGRSAMLEGTATLVGLPGGPDNARRWARTVEFTPDGGSDADLGDVRRIDLVAGEGRARVWVRDVSSVGDTVPTSSTPRPGHLELGAVRADEGDARGRGTAQVPWTIQGEVPAGTRFRVVIEDDRGIAHRDVMVPAGATTGSVPVTFPRNRTHEDRRVVQQLRAYALTGVNIADNHGRATVIDDDPAPKVRLKRKRRTVREGQVIKVVIKLARPVTQHRGYTYRFARAGRAEAQLGDLTRAWRLKHVGPGGVKKKLSQLGFRGQLQLRPRRKKVVIRIPVARDGVKEAREQVRLKVRGPGIRAATTVRLADRG
ncbi:hypothetical protein [Nocardioides alcanivorans]|uniref:hypothetical protein n=1 Tax=Nocardioides alcanivorans TaxID=2897352 RepID=UPI001F3F5427|nr:hypothetical protein [Nocardioides alcanivorans]